MPDNIRFTFDSVDGIIEFAEWVQENFEDGEEFEEYLADRVPGLSNFIEQDGFVTIMINPDEFLDEEEDLMINDALFWDIIESEYEDGAPDVSDISGTERMEE